MASRTSNGSTVISRGGSIAGFNIQMEANLTDGFGLTIQAAVRRQPLPASRRAPLPAPEQWAGAYVAPGGKQLEFVAGRYSFDAIVDGHGLRLFTSGMPMYRVP